MNSPKIIILLLTVLILTGSTFFVMVKHPDMHKQVLITDANYIFVEEELPAAKPIEIQLQGPKVQQAVHPQSKVKSKPLPKINKNIQPQKRQTKPVVKPQQPKRSVETKTYTPKPVVQKTAIKKTKKAAPRKPETRKPAIEVKEDTLTEREEIIAWNNWRSGIQNQVMRDTKIGAPLGTQFLFSFTVDKFGNMSNIKVWSPNPVYTDLGERVIKPVLMSYQNKPILYFPEGTKRTITNVSGGIYISTTTQFSSSKNYNDYEKVKRTN